MTNKERLDEIKNNYSVGIHILSGKPSVAIPKENFEWLINRVEELEKENRELNMEIGTYSSKIDEIQRSIGVKLADLKILSTQMLKGDSKMSERLENMSPIGFDLDGNLLVKSEDYHWLMEQAEKSIKYYELLHDIANLAYYKEQDAEYYKSLLKQVVLFARNALEGDE